MKKLSSSQITCQFSLASYLNLAMTTAAGIGRYYSSHNISVFYHLYGKKHCNGAKHLRLFSVIFKRQEFETATITAATCFLYIIQNHETEVTLNLKPHRHNRVICMLHINFIKHNLYKQKIQLLPLLTVIIASVREIS